MLRIFRITLFLDKDRASANGLFALDIAHAHEGPGYFFLDRISTEQWQNSELYRDMPPLGENTASIFPHQSTLLPHLG